ncbi:hypothetical protein CK203_087198 [Vitis vinifera]|uniref:Retrotransposon gag domain-containing protein n=1 Tax=Vitis vinifera TaxID=29760 RepID=A0A438BS82_VITVI|nr:hypothetical protein CK203_087198 [Vitis vinifera]
MEAINACPHHGFDTWLLVSYLYNGMSSSMKQLLETICGGDFMSKNPEEAMDFLSYVAEVSRGWDEPNKGEVGKMKSQPNAFNAKAGILEELELKKIHEVQVVAETPVQVKPCPTCQSYEHLVEECPTIPTAREMFGEQANVIGQFKPNNNACMEILTTQVGGTIQIFLGSQEHLDGWMQNDLSHKIDNLQYSISRLTNLNTVQEKGRFPSQPHQNPKVELPTPKPHVEEEEEEETEKRRKSKERRKISDLCTIKRGLNVNKKAFLTEQVSSIIQCKSPLKYKDPGCPTISVMIGGKVVEKALLDLGASVNLLPYSVYKQLGLGELKPTSITLSLTDRSMKIPRGIVEDVLVQVDNFYYPVDFVVLDTDPIVKETNHVPIILGRPFLATSNVIINCRNGLMQLTFGNMTLELNIFLYVQKANHSGRRRRSKREGLSEPSDVLTTLQGWRGEKKFYLCSIKRRHKKLLKKRPHSSI